jgi:probable phosphoglycerate mutase
MRVYLIRHGETHSNARRIVQLPDDPLSPKGLQQAAQLAERLADCGIVRLISSDLRRAAMTTSCIAEATGLVPEFSERLHERNFGDLRGTPYDELTFDPFALDYEPPGGESWQSFYDRVRGAWSDIESLASESEPLAVVTHGLVLRAILDRHLGVDLNDSQASATARQIANTSVTIIERADAGWQVHTLTCTRHLSSHSSATGTA